MLRDTGFTDSSGSPIMEGDILLIDMNLLPEISKFVKYYKGFVADSRYVEIHIKPTDGLYMSIETFLLKSDLMPLTEVEYYFLEVKEKMTYQEFFDDFITYEKNYNAPYNFTWRTNELSECKFNQEENVWIKIDKSMFQKEQL